MPSPCHRLTLRTDVGSGPETPEVNLGLILPFVLYLSSPRFLRGQQAFPDMSVSPPPLLALASVFGSGSPRRPPLPSMLLKASAPRANPVVRKGHAARSCHPPPPRPPPALGAHFLSVRANHFPPLAIFAANAERQSVTRALGAATPPSAFRTPP